MPSDTESGIFSEAEYLVGPVASKNDTESASFSEEESIVVITFIDDTDGFGFSEDGEFSGVYIIANEAIIFSEFNFTKLPTLNIALNQSIKTAAPSWTDISAFLKHYHFRRGRMHELDRIEAGELVLTLDNTDGRFWRGNDSSSLYPYFKPLTLVKLEFFYAGSAQPRFYGVIEDVAHDWQDKDAAVGGYIEVPCVDFFKALTRARIYDANPTLQADATAGNDVIYLDSVENLVIGQSLKIYDDINAEINTIEMILPEYNSVVLVNNLANTYHMADNAKAKKFPQVKSGTRITDILLEWGLPAALMAIDAGQVDVIELTIGDDGLCSLEEIQATADAEDGVIFQADDGIMTFLDSLAMLANPYNTSQATLKDDGNDSKYSVPQIADEDKFIYNQATITGDGITKQSYAETTLQDEQGQRVLPKADSRIAAEYDAFNQCFVKVQRYKDSILRPHKITIKPEASETDLYPKATGFDLKTRITLQLDSVTNPAGIDHDYHIEGIIEDWDVEGGLLTAWQLWEVNQYRIFIPDHDGYLINIDETSYDDCHDAASASQAAVNDDPDEMEIGQWTVYAGAIFTSARIERGYIEFDTSEIATEDTISEAFVLFYLNSFSVDNAWSLQITSRDIVTSPIEQADYGLLGDCSLDFGKASVTKSGWLVIPLSALGIAAIVKEGTTRFGLRSTRDINADDPGAASEEWAEIGSALSTHPPRLITRLA
ncbi:MAG: hypothetical protein WC329_01680 [Candidatus Omnitrophota bacterium]|jgi:hypothetical protein